MGYGACGEAWMGGGLRVPGAGPAGDGDRGGGDQAPS
jgi:hypothetical protein